MLDPEKLQETLDQAFPRHPFAPPLSIDQLRALLPRYLAMSQLFPHLQAGAHHRFALRALRSGVGVPHDQEVTGSVGAFLVFDEFGAWGKTRAAGVAALASITNSAGFHANLLKNDLRALTGHEISPEFDGPTNRYLRRLGHGLSSLDPVSRCAMMVSFERHADRMITALWESIAQAFGVEKEKLEYFRTHVGGDDPAEAYHVAMTTQMIAQLVASDEQERFIDELVDAYGRHVEWCAAIIPEHQARAAA